MLIDSHCHLDRFQKKGTLDSILLRAQEAGVERIVAIGTSRADWNTYAELASAQPERISYTVGLHPTDIEEDWQDQLQMLEPAFSVDPAPVAIGEIGLDHFHLPKSPERAEEIKRRQSEVFKRQLELARKLDVPVVVHSRNSFYECLKVIDQSGFDWRKVVFHCFADGPEEMELLNNRGGRGSFTGIITYKNAEAIREAARFQGLDTIMVETDAPYLAPVPMRGKQNEPAYVRHTAAFCAELFGFDLPAFASFASRNTKQFFGLD